MYQLTITKDIKKIEFQYQNLGDLHTYLMELEHKKVIDTEFLASITKKMLTYNKEDRFINGEYLCDVGKNGLMLKIEYLK